MKSGALACGRSSHKVRFINKQVCYFYVEDALSASADDEIIELDDTSHPSLPMPQIKKTIDFASTLCYKLDQLSEKHESGLRFDERLISKCDELRHVLRRGGSCDALQVLAEDIHAMQRSATPSSDHRKEQHGLLLEQQEFSDTQQISSSSQQAPTTEDIKEVVGSTVKTLRELCGMCPPGHILDIREMTTALKEACLDNQEKTIASVVEQINLNIIDIIQKCKLNATSNKSN